MAGRFAYFLIAGGALIGGMFAQGDLNVDREEAEREMRALVDGDVDRPVAGEAGARVEVGGDVISDQATKRALSQAVAELVRAEGSLISLRIDDKTPAEAIKRAEDRRNAAKQAVERIADEAKAESRGDRDALREIIRDEVREAVRS